ncbi:MAG: dienelactone hydrolase family protein [Acidimicrobiales bacterium]
MPDEVANPRQNVTFASNGNHAHGYLALPEAAQGPGVVVIQEWWGLTSHIADVTDRLAREGFVALAPDLYGGPTTHDAAEAGEMMSALPVERATRDLAGAIDFLLARPEVTSKTVGLVGFCMGGAFVLRMAAQEGRRVAAAVPFYPVGPMPDDYSGLQAAVLAHFGDQDAFMAPDAATTLESSLRTGNPSEIKIVRYPAGHAFLNDENLLGTYDPEAARAAWDATVSFLRANVV